MHSAADRLPNNIDTLKSLLIQQAAEVGSLTDKNKQLSTENQRYKTQVLSLQEQLNLALARRYAASSEKVSPDQIWLFDEAETEQTAEADPAEADTVTIAAHTRQKTGRKPLQNTL